MILTKHRWKCVGLLVLPTWLGATCFGFASPGPQESKPVEPPEVKLERVLPRSPQEAMQAFDVAPGFGVELVASEPMVVDPIAALFDDHGRMVVIEMIDYSEEAQAKLGRVKRLSDLDGDGAMDKVEVLADRLSWPTALALVGSDVIVAHPPKLSLIHETQPGVFQLEERWEGLSRSNVQGMANSFRWGLDNRWHLSTSSNGGALTGSGIPRPIGLQGRDLVIDSRGWSFTTEPGGGQHGMDFNAWGDKFVTSNSDHLQQIVGWDLNPNVTKHAISIPAWRRSIAADGPQAEVYRDSPVEAWRTWRTQLRLTGQHAGLIEGGGRAAGYFTGATGVFVLDGDQLDLTNPPQVVVADVGGNLVHRKQLQEQGLQWTGIRIDRESEFLRSRDIWFRPVQFCDGPDGCLYILDMYREVIEHPASLPPPIKSQLDLNSGNDRGRIWRLRRTDHAIRRRVSPLAELATRELVSMVGHHNGWHRETASRLLYERHDLQAIEPLRQLCRECPLPEGRIQALACLSGFETGLNGLDWKAMLQDPHPRVQRWVIHQLGRALQVSSERQAIITPIQSTLEKLGHTPSLLIRWQLAASVAPWMEDGKRGDYLWSLIGDDWNSPEFRTVVVSAAGKDASSLLRRMALGNPQPEALQGQGEWIRCLLREMSVHHGVVDSMERGTEYISTASLTPQQQVLWLAAMRDELRSQWASLDANSQAKLRAWLCDFALPAIEMYFVREGFIAGNDIEQYLGVEGTRAMVGLASVFEPEKRLDLLKRALEETHLPALQQAAIEFWVQNEVETTQVALQNVSRLSGESQAILLSQMAKRLETAKLFIPALDQRLIQPTQIAVDVWRQLASYQDDDLQRGLAPWKPTVKPSNWEALATQYREAWKEPGNAEEGKIIFQKQCASCHKHQGLGNEIGPGLASLQSKSNDQIALSIAEPSREIDPKFQAYQWILDDGELVVGLLEESQVDRLFIRDTQGERRILERSSIAKTRTSAASLMPEGLLDQIDPRSLNNLIQFLRSR